MRSPQLPTHCRSGVGGYGEEQSYRTRTQGHAMGWGWAVCRPGSLSQTESSWGGKGCVGCTPCRQCTEGMPRAQGWGGAEAVLTTVDMSSSVLCWLQDTGRGKEESAAVGIPMASAAPPCSIPAPLVQVGVEVCAQGTPPILLGSVTYCPHLCLPARG